MIIEDTGQFWWEGEEDINSATGELTIDENGLTTLRMHAPLGNEALPDNLMMRTKQPGKKIRGRLISSGNCVLLDELESSVRSFNSLSFNYYPRHCYVADKHIDDAVFTGMRLHVQGLNDWLRPGMIECDGDTEDEVTFVLKTEPDYHWNLDTLNLYLKNHITYKTSHSPHISLSAEVQICFELISDQKIVSEDMLDWMRGLEEFISLVSGGSYVFPWPEMMWMEDDIDCSATCYFQRGNLSESNITTTGLFPFSRISNEFGTLFNIWQSKRKVIGPGLHLYTGTIKNPHMYIEHRFVSLIWGLEALDRLKPECAPGVAEQERAEKALRLIQLICTRSDGEYITGLNKSDRIWLKKAINNAAERTLAERIYDMLKPVSMDINAKLLQTFCEECATQRNRLSHTGGVKHAKDYKDFINEIYPLQKALEVMYRLVLLTLIGLDSSLIREIVYDSLQSFQILFYYYKAELITKEDFTRLKGDAATKFD